MASLRVLGVVVDERLLRGGLASSFPVWLSEMGTRLAFLICLIFSVAHVHRLAQLLRRRRRRRARAIRRSILDMRLMISNRCTGRRIVRLWSLIDRVTAWRIHQCA